MKACRRQGREVYRILGQNPPVGRASVKTLPCCSRTEQEGAKAATRRCVHPWQLDRSEAAWPIVVAAGVVGGRGWALNML